MKYSPPTITVPKQLFPYYRLFRSITTTFLVKYSHTFPLLDRLRSDLGLKNGQTTTDDLMFTVETVSCLGACGLAPVLTVNDKVYPAMTPDKATELLIELKEGANK